MRISDGSSDVCSSDLIARSRFVGLALTEIVEAVAFPRRCPLVAEPGRRRKPWRLEHQIGGGRCYRIFLRQPLGIREYFRREVAALHVELHGRLFQANVDIIWGQTHFARDILGSLAIVDASSDEHT